MFVYLLYELIGSNKIVKAIVDDKNEALKWIQALRPDLKLRQYEEFKLNKI